MASSSDSRRSLHVYNVRCALTVDPSRNRRGDVYTANLETAARANAGAEFDWANKIVVQITGEELPDVIAVLLGLRSDVEFRFHGAARDKGYRLFRDDERLIVQVFAGGDDRHTVALAPSDRLRVCSTLFRQLQRNHGGLPADVLHAMLTQVYSSSAPVETPSPTGTSSSDAPHEPPAGTYDW